MLVWKFNGGSRLLLFCGLLLYGVMHSGGAEYVVTCLTAAADAAIFGFFRCVPWFELHHQQSIYIRYIEREREFDLVSHQTNRQHSSRQQHEFLID